MSIRGLCLIVAVVCFLLAAFNASFAGLNFIAIGLAFFAGAFLLEGRV